MAFWNSLFGGERITLEVDLDNDQPAPAPNTVGVTWLDGGPFSGNPTYTVRDWIDEHTGSAAATASYTDIQITIPSNRVIGGDFTTKSFDLGNFPGQNITVINNGYIVGKSGDGGPAPGGNLNAGGSALRIPQNINSLTIENNGIIAGGGRSGPCTSTTGVQITEEPAESQGGDPKDPPVCVPGSPITAAGISGSGAGYIAQSPTNPISPPVSTPESSFPIGPVTFGVGPGTPVSQPLGPAPCNSPTDVTGSGAPGSKLGSTPAPSPTGSYIIGEDMSKVTIINNPGGNIYGPNTNPLGPNHPFGPQPAQP